MGRPLPLAWLRRGNRKVERAGRTKTAARLALQEELRRQRGERTEVLRPESRFRDAADIWMGKIRERRADSTADTYASCLKNQVLPQLGELRLVECDVATLDAFFSRLERARKVVQQPEGSMGEKPQHAANTRRMIRAIVGGIMQQAVLQQAIAANPVRDLERIESLKGHRKAPPRRLTAEERRRLLAFVASARSGTTPCAGWRCGCRNEATDAEPLGMGYDSGVAFPEPTSVSRVQENRMHGLTGGDWKRNVGHGRSESCREETLGRSAKT